MTKFIKKFIEPFKSIVYYKNNKQIVKYNNDICICKYSTVNSTCFYSCLNPKKYYNDDCLLMRYLCLSSCNNCEEK